MKLTTTASILTNALRRLLPVVRPASSIPILGCVKFEGNKITATDLDIEFEIAVPVSSAKGAICIAHRPLLR